MYYTWNSTKEAEKRDPGNEGVQNGHFCFHVFNVIGAMNCCWALLYFVRFEASSTLL